MTIRTCLVILFLTMSISFGQAVAGNYQSAKVVYDLSSPNKSHFKQLLDRVSYLQNLYGGDSFSASIIVVIHEGAVPLFTRKSNTEQLKQRANNLTMGEIIEFRLCAASAKMQGFTANDFPEFVHLVPMADAEIVALQNAGYAYLH